MIELKVNEHGRMPEYKTWGAAAADVYSAEDCCIRPGDTEKISTGLFICTDRVQATDEHLEIRPRSGLSAAGIFAQLGTIDADYTGEIGVLLHNTTARNYVVGKGDRIAQIMLCIHGKIDGTLQSKAVRQGGWGSTGMD